MPFAFFVFMLKTLIIIYIIIYNRTSISFQLSQETFQQCNKKLSNGLPEYEITVTQDIFWTDYTDFDNKNGSFDGDEFIRKRKDIRDGNIHLWHQKYSLPCTKVLGFVSCAVTSKVLGIGIAERSQGDVQKTKSGKIYP